MNPREIIETVAIGVGLLAGLIALRRARRETAGLSDDNARKLREDVTLLDRAMRALRRKLIQLERWVVAHMWEDHNERFDPSTVYDPTEEVE